MVSDNEQILNNKAKKTAFVLSGGGSRGALEVGALLALLEQGIHPDILVGTSVGAINAAALGNNPTLEGARWLEKIWCEVTKEKVMPQNYLSMVWRLVTGETGLMNNDRLRELIESNMPDDVRRFNDFKDAEVYITAVDLRLGRLHVFGIDPTESILDAIMASTALPPFLSPWQYRNEKYVDGGVVNDLPLKVAVERNATDIYAIDVGQQRMARWHDRGVFGVMGQTIDAIVRNQLRSDMGWAEALYNCNVNYIGIGSFEKIRIWNFKYTEAMIEEGKQVTLDYLKKNEE